VIALSLEIAGLKRPLQFDSSVGAFGSSCVERHRVGPWSGPVKPGTPLDLRAAMKSKH
jgi:hypothetical protein